MISQAIIFQAIVRRAGAGIFRVSRPGESAAASFTPACPMVSDHESHELHLVTGRQIV